MHVGTCPAPTVHRCESDVLRYVMSRPSTGDETEFAYWLRISESRVNEETSLERSLSERDLMTEATNDLFQKLGKARIADLNRRDAP